jgi:hypothetical protein
MKKKSRVHLSALDLGSYSRRGFFQSLNWSNGCGARRGITTVAVIFEVHPTANAG